MSLIPTSKFEFEARLENTRACLETNGMDACICINTRNIYWLSGSAQASHLVIFKDQDPILLVRRNIDLARKHSWFPTEWIKPLGSTKDTIGTVTAALNGGTGKIGMELNGLPASYYLTFVKGFGSDVQIENISETLRNLRMIKDAGEIEKIQQAARCAEKTQDIVYHMTMEEFTPGTTEREIAAEMVHVAKLNRSEHYSIYDNNQFTNFNNFFIVTSGEALWTPSTFPIMSGAGFSPAIPYGPSDRVLEEGDMLVCDYAVLVDGYHADHARSYVMNGVYPEYYKERYANLKLAYDRSIDAMEPGMKASELFALMETELIRIGDPNPNIKIEKYFEGNGTIYQGYGHGIGLELDEPPFILKSVETPLEEHMAISLEPKIMIPGWGAINFEDNFILESGQKARQITNTRYLEW
ncbi:MAG TPA: Xaa-Pro peptidase family protein [Candidatus Lokiarchaeia archaeon]|nr:Xaa-Pro peptidase family protein [Candidatus Lokiarchaeia archaeon]